MSDYVKIANYAAKDSLPQGDLNKIIRGTELGAEFDAIAIAVATKYDSTDLNVTLQQYSADTVTFASGTKLLFQQTSAPTGWTKVTTYNDAALRVVSGAASTGGADAFTTIFGLSKTTAPHTLTSAQIPGHTHDVSGTTDNDSPDHTHNIGIFSSTVSDGTGTPRSFMFSGGSTVTGTANNRHTHTYSTTTGAGTGGNGNHSHNLSNFDLKYVDCIIATKN
jgi:microcystin-dependent protein